MRRSLLLLAAVLLSSGCTAQTVGTGPTADPDPSSQDEGAPADEPAASAEDEIVADEENATANAFVSVRVNGARATATKIEARPEDYSGSVAYHVKIELSLPGETGTPRIEMIIARVGSDCSSQFAYVNAKGGRHIEPSPESTDFTCGLEITKFPNALDTHVAGTFAGPLYGGVTVTATFDIETDWP